MRRRYCRGRGGGACRPEALVGARRARRRRLFVNGENAAADGVGIDVKTAEDLLAGGADVITTGNHIWRKREIRDYLEREERVLRPANYPPGTPGSGYVVINVSSYRLLVMNILGSLYMEALGDPFAAAEHP